MKYTLVLFCPQVAAGIWIASISAGVFAFNSSVYSFFPFLFTRASILVRPTSNEVVDSTSRWNTKDFLKPCPNQFLWFHNADPKEWTRIGSFDPCTLTR